MAHLHSIYDTDKHFKIDPITRNITSESPKTTLMQYDHNSERFTFEIPRFIEGHDMLLSDSVRIHYINIGQTSMDRQPGVYEVDDVQISPDSDDVVIFSWLISRNCTQFNGTLNFAIRFNCMTNEELDYSWGTGIFAGIKVSNGLDNSEVVIDSYVDILEQWKRELYSRIDSIENKVENIEVPEIPEFPTSLPNPNAITFTGAIDATYDGSEAVTISIPDCSGGIDSNSVHYTEDTDKTDAERAMARYNIGAQEVINDLSEIRRGAELGSTSVQESDVNEINIIKANSATLNIANDNDVVTPAGANEIAKTKRLVITLTGKGTTSSPYTIDKTCEEIVNAYNENADIWLLEGGVFRPLVKYFHDTTRHVFNFMYIISMTTLSFDINSRTYAVTKSNRNFALGQTVTINNTACTTWEQLLAALDGLTF